MPADVIDQFEKNVYYSLEASLAFPNSHETALNLKSQISVLQLKGNVQLLCISIDKSQLPNSTLIDHCAQGPVNRFERDLVKVARNNIKWMHQLCNTSSEFKEVVTKLVYKHGTPDTADEILQVIRILDPTVRRARPLEAGGCWSLLLRRFGLFRDNNADARQPPVLVTQPPGTSGGVPSALKTQAAQGPELNIQ